MNLITKIFNKVFLSLCYRDFWKFLPDKTYIKILYKVKMGKRLNLNDPQTFNEKMQWLKLYDRRDIYTKMVDKYEAKEYVSNIIGREHIIPTLGVYEKFDDIDFDKLPNQFVIKCTHDSGGLVICKDKSKLDLNMAKKKINKCLKHNFYYRGREWPYKNVKPRIIIEKFMCLDGKYGVIDYKFQMMNGELKYLYVCTDRDSGHVKFTHYDANKKFIDMIQSGYDYDKKKGKLPKTYDKMLEYAKKLSKDIPSLRVDFYDIDGKIYFGELTFYDSAGFLEFEPREWDLKFGQMLDLTTVKKNEK